MQTPQLDSGESRNDDGHTVVWTDGASRNNQDARVRRAGCGIFYAPGHDLNFSCILPGLVQSNQRAELLAIVLALNRDPRSLELRTDSQYVYDGACAWHSWRERGWRGANADLWLRLSHAMAARPAVSTNFTKVKGHALDIDVQRGRVLPIDKWGNDGADACACAGADRHAVPDSVLRVFAFRNIAATGTHKMMIEILRRRRAAERVAGQTCDDVEPEHELADLSSGLDELAFSESIPGDTG